ncbi:cupin domain-containing protein [Flavobacterium sp. ENC]|uniref:cupin domain-containing protein n=1 Tax=Flavobacterium sp. ENC TaxID=2897330 RepID=UPI001E4D6B4A|nr:cupin domain-containing protein [Flavobacterium sp. ENC]MCD0467009.1 cupin domain-containing protein [Flavobacterium sp. ENC]
MKKLMYLFAISASIAMQSCKNNSESSADIAGSTAIAADSASTSETPAAEVASGGTDIKGIVWKELEKLPLASDPAKEESIGIAVIQPSAPAEKHSHAENEIGYVLEGESELEVEGQPSRTIRAGDSFAIPAGRVHRAKPTGSVPLKVVVTYIVAKGEPLARPAK